MSPEMHSKLAWQCKCQCSGQQTASQRCPAALSLSHIYPLCEHIEQWGSYTCLQTRASAIQTGMIGQDTLLLPACIDINQHFMAEQGMIM